MWEKIGVVEQSQWSKCKQPSDNKWANKGPAVCA